MEKIKMKRLLFWLACRAHSVSYNMNLLAEWLSDKSSTPDYSIPYYPEGPEGDQ